MRAMVVSKIRELMGRYKDVYFLTADLGYSVLEDLEKQFPKRFINVGVAEQNMIGIAAGLALSGKKVFVYSIIPFVTMRCLEQIRDDICYHNLDVKIIGIGTGLSYGILGGTHFALEDIGIMGSLPHMTVVSPVDPMEASLATEASYFYSGPLYLRIGKKEEPVIYKKKYNFKIGRGNIIRRGKDIVILTTGTIANNVIEAEKILRKKYGISAEIVGIHTLKPIDKNLLLQTTKNKKAVFTVEEHSIVCGLGSIIATTLIEERNRVPLRRIGTEDEFIKHIGSQEYIRDQVGLSSVKIAAQIHKMLKQ